MSDAIKKLHDYLAMSPSVVYPEDVLAYLPAIEDENAKLREENDKLVKVLHEVESEAIDAYLCLQHDCELLVGELEERFRKYWHEQAENAKLRELASELLRELVKADRSRSHGWLFEAARELGVEEA